MEKKISLRLEDYEPAETRIYRVLPGEVPDDFTDKYAEASISVNDAMCEAFEKDPRSETIRNITEFASLEQYLDTKYVSEISAIAGIGTDEDYKRYLSMLIAIADEIFGENSSFATEIRKLVNGEDPDVWSSLDLVFAFNALVERTLKAV